VVLASKLAVPALPQWYVARPRLTDQLDMAVGWGTTVVTGVAAAGKTVLGAGWARSGAWKGRIAWLTLDRDDNHPGVFWSSVVTTLRDAGVQITGIGGDWAGADSDSADQPRLVSLVDALRAEDTPIVLVLDRFDAVTNREIGESLDFVIQHAAPALRLLVLARDARSLPLYRPRLHGGVSEITNADLSFTQDEARALLQRHGLRLPEAECTRLRQLCEGWGGALRLFALAEDPNSGTGDRPASARPAVGELLIREVFDVQPPPARDLLLRTSVLSDITVDLADRLTGRFDAQALLDGLARSNAFVQEVESRTYRCHKLFRQVLRAELGCGDPQLVRQVHSVAGRWFASRGLLLEAVLHSVAAEDWSYAASAVVNGYGLVALLGGPDSEPLRRSLSALPPATPGCHAALVDAVLAIEREDVSAAAASVGRALAAAAELDTADREPFEAGVALVQTMVHRFHGQAEQALAVASATADLGNAGREWPLRAETRLLTLAQAGAAQVFAGDGPRARKILGEVVNDCGSHGLELPRSEALGQLALLAIADGDLDEASRLAREGLEATERLVQTSVLDTGASSVALAGVALEWNRPWEAVDHLARAEATAGARFDPGVGVVVASLRSRLALGRADLPGAREIVDGASRVFSRRLGRYPGPALATQGVLAHLLSGDIAAATDLVDQLSDSMDRTLLRARICLSTGRTGEARQILAGPGPRFSVRAGVTWLLLRAELAAILGDEVTARVTVRTALVMARQGRWRRRFAEAGPWLRRLLRRCPELVAEHPWLSPGPDNRPDSAEGCWEPPLLEALTDRESQVLRCVARAMSIRDISGELYLSSNTVKTHLKNIYRKLAVNDRSKAAQRARQLRLIES
jgi:LuxR family maltose regulon positive regulatory protein